MISRSYFLLFLLLATQILTVLGVCRKKEIYGSVAIPGHHPIPWRYNICVDSTTISPEPSLTNSEVAVFVRECCGCRVSSVTGRELRVQPLSPGTSSRVIYLPEIRACECIPCDSSVFNWVDYFRSLEHKRRK
ncbi:unnamed protein product [Lymnaea stagnalis]|uniref:Uncharacterized protein n=1 Tax=Lymnaea stagnalis TaxID=6523 RepID=A0AAV2ILB1_LYMST